MLRFKDQIFMFKLIGIVFALYTVFAADCCRLPEEPVLAFDTFFHGGSLEVKTPGVQQPV